MVKIPVRRHARGASERWFVSLFDQPATAAAVSVPRKYRTTASAP
jgi:hypothetical protein